MFTTKELSDATGLGLSSVRSWGAQLPTESTVQERITRQWTMGDSCQLLIANQLHERGFAIAASLAFAAATAPEYVRLTADEAASAYLVARRDAGAACGWSAQILHEKADAARLVFATDGAVVFDVRALLAEAMAVLLATKRRECAA